MRQRETRALVQQPEKNSNLELDLSVCTIFLLYSRPFANPRGYAVEEFHS